MLMTPEELIKYLEISDSTYFRMLRTGDLPPRTKITNRISRFRVRDVDEWIQEKISQQYQ